MEKIGKQRAYAKIAASILFMAASFGVGVSPLRAADPAVVGNTAEFAERLYKAEAAAVVASPRIKPDRVDAAIALDRLVQQLGEGRESAFRRLEALGFKEIVDQMRRLDDEPSVSLSAQTSLETLYQCAQKARPGEGLRFLAFLYYAEADRSALIASEPSLSVLRAQPRPDVSENPIRFADPATLSPAELSAPLPVALEAGVALLADYFAGPSLGTIRGAFLTTFQKPGFDNRKFEQVLAESRTHKEAVRRLFRDGTPPPAMATAMLQVLMKAPEGALLGIDPRFAPLIDALSRELPEKHRRYVEREAQLETRVRQKSEGAKHYSAGVELESSDAHVKRNFEGPPDPPLAGATFSPRPPGGGAPGGAAVADYVSYSTSAMESQSSGGGDHPDFNPFRGGTPRSYRTAIRSSKAARGVAAGGALADETGVAPRSALWVPNYSDNRFGRLFVEYETPTGHRFVAASRVLFSDSAFAAFSTLWDAHDFEAEFRPGDLLIIMSMDPSATESLMTPAVLSRAQIDAANAGSLAEARQFLPRKIVHHPSLIGRELAWSCSRVDFAFNWLDEYFKEAGALGGQEIPLVRRAFEASISNAATWQFFESDAALRVTALSNGYSRLVLESRLPDTRLSLPQGSHFGISIFKRPELVANTISYAGRLVRDRSEPSLSRLRETEALAQPVLDWLAVNHPDFMRLNDYSEALMLARWLRAKNTRLTVIDLDGVEVGITVPDRVYLYSGPETPPVEGYKNIQQ